MMYSLYWKESGTHLINSGRLFLLAGIIAAGTVSLQMPMTVRAESAETEALETEVPGTGKAARNFGNLHEFTAVTTDGEEVTQEIFAEKDITMVNCWTTWCGYCIQEMPEIAELQEQLPENVQIILLGLDWEDDPAYAQDLLDEAGYTGTTLQSGKGDLHIFSQMVMYLPTTVFFDSEGNAIGDPIVGAPRNPKEDYLEAINVSLEKIGKEPVALQEEQMTE